MTCGKCWLQLEEDFFFLRAMVTSTREKSEVRLFDNSVSPVLFGLFSIFKL